ncbi:MAG: thioesterase family protein [Pseudomonadota bacterium]
MNLYLRLLLTLIFGVRRERLAPHQESNSSFRVLPHDIDVFGHMNNGRYLQIMDVARVQWMLQAGVLRAMRVSRWGATLGGNLIRYRHALKLFRRYVVRTRLVHWNERWFFFEHAFIDGDGRTVATGLSRAALRDRQGWVSTDVVVGAVAPGACTPPMPDAVTRWLAADQTLERCQARCDTQPTSPSLEHAS